MDRKNMEKLWDEMHKMNTPKVAVEKNIESNYVLPEQKKQTVNFQASPAVMAKQATVAPQSIPKQNMPKQNSPLLEKEVHFSFKPKRMIKLTGILVLLLLIFSLGRLSVNVPGATNEGSSLIGLFSFFSSDAEKEALDTVVEETPVEEVPVETETAAPEVSTEETPAPVEETPVEEVEVQEPVPEKEEAIITTYQKVSLAVTSMGYDWKGTWGKLDKVYYTIKNEELGTVKPAYITMMVEGYTDQGSMKKIPLGADSLTIKSKTLVSSAVTIPNGFAYNQMETGDLSAVDIIFQLYDENNKQITMFRKSFSLGEK